MCEGYDPHLGDEPPVSGLDEYLCEYVDGTMDPLVREVFEEYLCANPEVAAHAERLREARSVLRCYGCRCRAPRGLHAKLRRRLAAEAVGDVIRVPYPAAFQLNSIAVFASAVAVALLLGLAVGNTLDAPGPGAFGTRLVQPAPSRHAVPLASSVRAFHSPALAGAASFGTMWHAAAPADSGGLMAISAVRSFRVTP